MSVKKILKWSIITFVIYQIIKITHMFIKDVKALNISEEKTDEESIASALAGHNINKDKQ